MLTADHVTACTHLDKCDNKSNFTFNQNKNNKYENTVQWCMAMIEWHWY